MKDVNSLIAYCNYDYGTSYSKCIYAVGRNSYGSKIFVINKSYNDITGIGFHVNIVTNYYDDIISVGVKVFDTFAEAKALLDVMTYSHYDVYVNECEEC